MTISRRRLLTQPAKLHAFALPAARANGCMRCAAEGMHGGMASGLASVRWPFELPACAEGKGAVNRRGPGGVEAGGELR